MLENTDSEVIIKSLFNKYDESGDGRIDKEEFRSLCEDVGYPLDDEALEYAFRLVDTNGNREVSFDEFLDFWRHNDKFKRLEASQLEEMSEAAKLFRRYDLDSDRVISFDEFKVLCQDLGYNLNADQISHYFSHMDKDNNNSISFSEFVEWLRWFNFDPSQSVTPNTQKQQ
eukprot:gb/GECH01002796.1/.p1 GENE.gb/GECH01002796.1/~~gb/GECH01002796.1/.p1  ORF type:complete len:171 (+),score=45.96 gb/GECH01002796.1/:1-513(+)